MKVKITLATRFKTLVINDDMDAESIEEAEAIAQIKYDDAMWQVQRVTEVNDEEN